MPPLWFIALLIGGWMTAMDLTHKIGKAINANNGRCTLIEDALVKALDFVMARTATECKPSIKVQSVFGHPRIEMTDGVNIVTLDVTREGARRLIGELTEVVRAVDDDMVGSGEFHCCRTGDCNHDNVHDCVDSLVEHIKELTKDCKQAEAISDEYAKMYCEMHTRWVRIAKGKFARALANLIEEGKASSDGRKAVVNSETIDDVERLFAKAIEYRPTNVTDNPVCG